VEVANIGVITAPVVGSGDWPAWMERVAKPCLDLSFAMTESYLLIRSLGECLH
jgi:hypothetical protein